MGLGRGLGVCVCIWRGLKVTQLAQQHMFDRCVALPQRHETGRYRTLCIWDKDTELSQKRLWGRQETARHESSAYHHKTCSLGQMTNYALWKWLIFESNWISLGQWDAVSLSLFPHRSLFAYLSLSLVFLMQFANWWGKWPSISTQINALTSKLSTATRILMDYFGQTDRHTCTHAHTHTNSYPIMPVDSTPDK